MLLVTSPMAGDGKSTVTTMVGAILRGDVQNPERRWRKCHRQHRAAIAARRQRHRGGRRSGAKISPRAAQCPPVEQRC